MSREGGVTPFEMVHDTTLKRVTLATGKGALGTWRSRGGQRRKPEEPSVFRTSLEVNRRGWGVCEPALEPHLSWEGLWRKAKVRTVLGKSDRTGS